MSALPPKADIRQRIEHVCFVPIADMQLLAQLGHLRRLSLILSRPEPFAFSLLSRNRGPSSPKKFSPAVFILPISLAHLGALGGQMHLSAFLRHCRWLSVAALGAMLAFAASAQTGSESQTPSTRTTGSESQTPSTVTPSAETQSESQGAPTSSNPATPKPNAASTTTQPRKAAAPEILILVSKPTQSMTVTVDGHVRYRWRISTGATHYSTPAGS
jgi:hypothetical protein